MDFHNRSGTSRSRSAFPRCLSGNVDFMGLSRRRTLLRYPVSPLSWHRNHYRLITPLESGHEGINCRDAMENSLIAYGPEGSEGDSGRAFRSLAALPSWFPTDCHSRSPQYIPCRFQVMMISLSIWPSTRRRAEKTNINSKRLMYQLDLNFLLDPV